VKGERWNPGRRPVAGVTPTRDKTFLINNLISLLVGEEKKKKKRKGAQMMASKFFHSIRCVSLDSPALRRITLLV